MRETTHPAHKLERLCSYREKRREDYQQTVFMPLGWRIFIALGNGEVGVKGREKWRREAERGLLVNSDTWYLKPFGRNVRGTGREKKTVIRRKLETK